MNRYLPILVLAFAGFAMLTGCPSNSGPTVKSQGSAGTEAAQAGKQLVDQGQLDPATPDGAVRRVIRGVGDRQLRAVWDFLPESFQGDLHDLVHTFGRQMDPEIWNRVGEVVRKLASVLRDKEEWLTTPETHAPPKSSLEAAAGTGANYPAVA
ncbi:MAG: hypothetical protein EHM42_08530, partial [Planctomycetaceae bacterium]